MSFHYEHLIVLTRMTVSPGYTMKYYCGVQTISCFLLKFVDQEAFKETVFEEKKDEEKEIEDEEEEIGELL